MRATRKFEQKNVSPSLEIISPKRRKTNLALQQKYAIFGIATYKIKAPFSANSSTKTVVAYFEEFKSHSKLLRPHFWSTILYIRITRYNFLYPRHTNDLARVVCKQKKKPRVVCNWLKHGDFNSISIN